MCLKAITAIIFSAACFTLWLPSSGLALADTVPETDRPAPLPPICLNGFKSSQLPDNVFSLLFYTNQLIC